MLGCEGRESPVADQGQNLSADQPADQDKVIKKSGTKTDQIQQSGSPSSLPFSPTLLQTVGRAEKMLRWFWFWLVGQEAASCYSVNSSQNLFGQQRLGRKKFDKEIESKCECLAGRGRTLNRVKERGKKGGKLLADCSQHCLLYNLQISIKAGGNEMKTWCKTVTTEPAAALPSSV